MHAGSVKPLAEIQQDVAHGPQSIKQPQEEVSQRQGIVVDPLNIT